MTRNGYLRRTWILKGRVGAIWTQLAYSPLLHPYCGDQKYPASTIVLTKRHGADWIYAHHLVISIVPTEDGSGVRVSEMHDTTGVFQGLFRKETDDFLRETANLIFQMKSAGTEN
jgi:hypothetical protein